MVLEPGCFVGPEAVIVGPTTVGENSSLGARAVVSRSIIWSGCRIGADAVLDDCVLTDDTLVEDGLVVRSTVCANLGYGRFALSAVPDAETPRGGPAEWVVPMRPAVVRRQRPARFAAPPAVFSPVAECGVSPDCQVAAPTAVKGRANGR